MENSAREEVVLNIVGYGDYSQGHSRGVEQFGTSIRHSLLYIWDGTVFLRCFEGI